MSEVKLFSSFEIAQSNYSGKWAHQLDYYRLEDKFLQVTAERDAALAAEQFLITVNGDLQQRLNAADERADVLEGLLLQTNELLYAIQGDPGAVPSSSIDAMRGEVFTALKPADGGGDEN